MTADLPLKGLRVLDFGHTVMGPSAGLMLADLGADVIKVEPSPMGDPTRKLKGFGTGYFGFFNRNKRSISIDLKSEKGLEVACKLMKSADILIENFGPDTMERLGLDWARVREINPRMIYASLKGFLPGPYDKRLALDEVVQMMTGLAYMTGPSGRPLRAGTSAVDIAGGMFAVIGILTALRRRDATGQGALVESALYEAAVFFMGQHLCYSAQTDGPIPPMPERVSAWAVYELFEIADKTQLFVGITTDAHWRRFCKAAGRPDLEENPALATNNDRIQNRATLIPIIKSLFAGLRRDEAVALCERAVIPFAPVLRPEDLFSDEHLAKTGGLLPTVLPSGVEVALPRLPIRLDATGFDLRNDPPQIGDATSIVLSELGYTEAEKTELISSGVITAQHAKSAELARIQGEQEWP